MNVNEYAERVLFGASLEEKLRLSPAPADFSENLRPPLSSGVLPTRPGALAFETSPGRSRPALPSRPSLVDDRSRGTLLHFFANHELLAAELMALALLKFPDAPPDFRRGLFQTLQEEQRHTLWYLARMRDCGIELGDFPVSRFFWDAVSPMPTPFDYVTRLSLTFEQANLDYAAHFARIMREAGDSRTARIMERIYRDEIRHVAYGLQWFRNWKRDGLTDWEAYRRALALPLSPSRAKGNRTPFNSAGRLASGLPEDFVRSLSVYERSKGRTPRVFLFNPDAEEELASPEPSCPPCGKVLSLIRDLEILQIFLARRDDVVLMRKLPSLEHLEHLRGLGLILPEFEELQPDGSLSPGSALRNRKLHRLCPWASTPRTAAILGDLTSRTTDGEALWRPEWKALFSKTAQAEFFGPWMEPATLVTRPGQVRELLARHGRSVLKRPFSAAGRGLRILSDGEEAEALAASWLENDGHLLGEPLHDRVLDFSVQFDVSGDAIEKRGLIHQRIGRGGRYHGSVYSPKFCKGLDPELSRFLMKEALPAYEDETPFSDLLFRWCSGAGHTGPVGVDAYVFRDGNGQLRLRALCEVNPRYTMGRIALEMRRAVAPGHALKIEMLNRSKSRPVADRNPETDPATGRITRGRVILNEISGDTLFVATMTVDKDPRHL